MMNKIKLSKILTTVDKIPVQTFDSPKYYFPRLLNQLREAFYNSVLSEYFSPLISEIWISSFDAYCVPIKLMNSLKELWNPKV